MMHSTLIKRVCSGVLIYILIQFYFPILYASPLCEEIDWDEGDVISCHSDSFVKKFLVMDMKTKNFYCCDEEAVKSDRKKGEGVEEQISIIKQITYEKALYKQYYPTISIDCIEGDEKGPIKLNIDLYELKECAKNRNRTEKNKCRKYMDTWIKLNVEMKDIIYFGKIIVVNQDRFYVEEDCLYDCYKEKIKEWIVKLSEEMNKVKCKRAELNIKYIDKIHKIEYEHIMKEMNK